MTLAHITLAEVAFVAAVFLVGLAAGALLTRRALARERAGR